MIAIPAISTVLERHPNIASSSLSRVFRVRVRSPNTNIDDECNMQYFVIVCPWAVLDLTTSITTQLPSSIADCRMSLTLMVTIHTRGGSSITDQ